MVLRQPQRAVVTADVSEGQEGGGGQLEADSWSPLVVAAARRGRATVPPASTPLRHWSDHHRVTAAHQGVMMQAGG